MRPWYALEVTCFNPDTTAVETLLFCTDRGFASGLSAAELGSWGFPLAGERWLPGVPLVADGTALLFDGRIIQPGNYKATAFESGKTFGASQVGYGEIVLHNKDGALDYLLNYAFTGRRAVLRAGYPDQAYPEGWQTVYTAGVEQALFDWTTVTLRLKDRQAELNVPLLADTFAGDTTSMNGGLEGTSSDLKSKPKPYLAGHVQNLSPPLVNSWRRIYAVNPHYGVIGSAVSDFDAVADLDALTSKMELVTRGILGPFDATAPLQVYDGGRLLTPGPDYVSQAELTASDGNFGTAGYRCWPDGGYFRLATAPVYQITCDATSANGALSPSEVVQELLETQAGWVQDVDFSGSDLNELNSYSGSWRMGLWYDQAATVSQALDRIMTTVGACYTFDRFGVLRITRVTPPTAVPADGLTLRGENILTVERRASGDAGAGVPAWKVRVRHGRNYTVQASGLSGSVTDDRRAWLAEQWRETVAQDSTVKDAWPLATELVFEADLSDETATDHDEAARRLAVFGSRRDRLDVTMRLADLAWQTVHPGMIIGLDLNGRYGYGGAHPATPMLCLGVVTDLARDQVTITLWG